MPTVDRIRSLQRIIAEKRLSCALLFYSRDVFYYTGTAQPCYLVVTPEDYCLYVRSGLEFALQEAFIAADKIKPQRRLEKIFAELGPRLSGNRIAVEMDVLPAAQFRRIQSLFAGCTFHDASPIVLRQRSIKDAHEIRLIRNACEVVAKGHDAVLSTLRDGITELELAAAVENAHRLAGHEGIFFIRQPDFFMSRGPLASGPNLFKISGVVYTLTGVGLSASVPAGPSKRKIAKGEPVILDIPTLVAGYHADQSRTYTVGKASHKVRTMHAQLKKIADYLIAQIKPGMACRDIYEKALQKAAELNALPTFLNFGNGKKSRLVGHGVGLELNEPPVIAPYDESAISEGNVMALDIHMLAEGIGAVKLEDMVLVGEHGNEILNITERKLFEIV